MAVPSLKEVGMIRDFCPQEYVGVVRPALGEVMVQLRANGRKK